VGPIFPLSLNREGEKERNAAWGATGQKEEADRLVGVVTNLNGEANVDEGRSNSHGGHASYWGNNENPMDYRGTRRNNNHKTYAEPRTKEGKGRIVSSSPGGEFG